MLICFIYVLTFMNVIYLYIGITLISWSRQ